MKKFFIFLLAITFMASSNFLISPCNVYATNPTISNNNITVYAEQTEWVYRFMDGKLQKRLWSITYNKWLTNWQWV